jgi:O-antigen ligase
MEKMKREELSQSFFFVGAIIFLVGLFASHALLSIGPAVMLLGALISGELKKRAKAIKYLPAVWLWIFIYLLYATSYFYTANKAGWAADLSRKIPMLAIPLAFALVKVWDQKKLTLFLYLLVGSTVLTMLGTVFSYLANTSGHDRMIYQSKNIPVITGIFHIHFGIVAAMAFFSALYLLRSRQFKLNRGTKIALAVSMTVILGGLHMLAYRTGLVVLYTGLLIELVRMVILRRRFLLGAGILISMLALPFIAYKSFNSVRMRVLSTKQDINTYLTGANPNYQSITQRLLAWENAFRLIKQHPIEGIGPADLDSELAVLYKIHSQYLMPENYVRIHNQYLSIATGLGIAGFLALMGLLIYPLTKKKARRSELFITWYSTMIPAMMIDSLFDLHGGLNLLLFFYGLCIIFPLRLEKEKGNENIAF